MDHSPSLPTLILYTRAGCHLCDEARTDLQAVLENRVKRGEPIARVRTVDIDATSELRARLNDLVPVLAMGNSELPMVMGQRTIEHFLDRTLGRSA